MRKLQAGEPLKILAWGDSVTTYNRWQKLFVARLRPSFRRKSNWSPRPGADYTASYLAEPPGTEHNYQEKVLDRKPDLIVSEFVNDAGLEPAQVEERYGRLLADFQASGPSGSS